MTDQPALDVFSPSNPRRTAARQRILLVAPAFPPVIGGAQRWGEEVARALHEQDDAVMVLAPRQRGDAEHDATLPFPVRRCLVPGDAMVWSAVAPIRSLLREFRPTAILAGHWSGAHAALRAAKGSVPVVCAVHGREVGYQPLRRFPPAQRIYDHARRHAFAHASAFACVSRNTRRLMQEAGADDARLHVVWNGVDVRPFLIPANTGLFARHGLAGRKILLTVARQVRRKGIDTVIRALPEMLRGEPDLTYVLVGDGPDRASLQAVAEECGVSSRVVFLGSLSEQDVIDAYQTCDLFIMTARDELPDVEGFGLVFLEAGACGKPVVGSWAGGIPDAVVHEQTGLLVNPLDTGEIAGAVLRILGDRSLAQRLGLAGKNSSCAARGWDVAAARLSLIFADLDARGAGVEDEPGLPTGDPSLAGATSG